MPQVRAVHDGDRKYAGFDFKGHRRINGEVFEWPEDRGMPLVVRDDNGLIVSGWVELVDEPSPKAERPKGRAGRDKIPGLVTNTQKRKVASDGNALSGRPSDRTID